LLRVEDCCNTSSSKTGGLELVGGVQPGYADKGRVGLASIGMAMLCSSLLEVW
jgi:hypothetical protein